MRRVSHSPLKSSLALRTIDSGNFTYYTNSEFAIKGTPRKPLTRSRLHTMSGSRTPTSLKRGSSLRSTLPPRRQKGPKKPPLKKTFKAFLPSSRLHSLAIEEDWKKGFVNGYQPLGTLARGRGWVLWAGLDVLTSTTYHLKQFKANSP
jgi:hypothetical protein